MPELDTITIEGFKSIKSVSELKLGNVNVIIGSNGSGKSNFIGVFSFLHAIREGHLQEYVAKANGADQILHFGSKQTPSLRIHVSFENEQNQYEIKLIPTDADELIPMSEHAYFWDRAHYPKPYDDSLTKIGKEAGLSETPENEKSLRNYVRRHLAGWRVYHFHDTGPSSPMKKISKVHDNRILRPDGANLSAFLYFLKKMYKDSYNLIRRAVQRVAPFFDDFQLEPLQLNPDAIRLEWRHRGSEAFFDVSSLSDGTLRFIALAALFLQPDSLKPSVILVDEPELGLHPYAITMLASLIKQASVKTQVIISTQSPLLLDNFEPEDVMVANRVDESTTIARLESEKLQHWLEEYSLGQLWEKNEFGGRLGGA